MVQPAANAGPHFHATIKTGKFHGHDDHVALKPHADVHHNGKGKRGDQAATDFLEPKELRADHIARHHHPIRPAVRTAETVDEGVALILHTAVPRDEQLRQVSHTHNGSSHDDDDVHVLHVLDVDVILEVHAFAHDEEQRLHHGKS